MGGPQMTPTRSYAVAIFSSAGYPPRPAAEVVLWIGPGEPPDWRDQDEWRTA